MIQGNWAEKRQHPRANFDWPVTMITDQEITISGTVKDISRGGILIHIGYSLQVNEQVKLAIEIPDFNDVISATGKIVRCFPVNEEEDPSIQAIGIRFTKISSEDLRYFSGNLAPEWAEKPSLSMRTRKKQVTPRRTSFGFTSFLWLVVLAIVFYQAFFHDHPTATNKTGLELEHKLLLLSKQITSEIESVRQSNQLLATNVIRTEERLVKIENETSYTDELNEMRSLLAAQALELRQLRGELKSKTTAVKKKKSTAEPLTYHTVLPGDTVFSIGRRYNMKVEELQNLNKLSNGTFIHPGQKLKIGRD